MRLLPVVVPAVELKSLPTEESLNKRKLPLGWLNGSGLGDAWSNVSVN